MITLVDGKLGAKNARFRLANSMKSRYNIEYINK